jgi:purine-binding chemotaxis protein CheW
MAKPSGPGIVTSRFLSFTLCGNEYAVLLSRVREVIALPSIRPVPQAPAHFKGIMSLRGNIISVIDLRLKFGLPEVAPGPESSIIILEIGTLSLGVIVDSVDNVLHVQPDHIKPPPELGAQAKSEFITGVIQRDTRLVLVMDLDKALDAADYKTIERGESDAGEASAA